MRKNLKVGSYWVCLCKDEPKLNDFTIFAKVLHIDEDRNIVYISRTQSFGFLALKPIGFEIKEFLELYTPVEDVTCSLK